LTASNNIVDLDGIDDRTFTYTWYRNNPLTSLANGSTYQLTQADVGFQILVKASYMDNSGASEHVYSTLTAAVTGINNSPTGTVTISGITEVGQTLTASNNIVDPDGIVGGISYLWYRNNTSVNATGSTYNLTLSDVGAQIKVVASFTDTYGETYNVPSEFTPVVTRANNPPTGTVIITGTLVQGETLTAVKNFDDLDGIVGQITYLWFRNNATTGFNGISYTLTSADVGFRMSVTAFYTDTYGVGEFAFSDQTAIVAARMNNSPTGEVTITGSTVVGQPLTASNNIVDPDGIVSATFVYKWYRNDVLLIQSNNSSTYLLTPNDAGSQIKVVASYTDTYGTQESVPSSSITIPAITFPDEPPELKQIVLSTASYTDIGSAIYRVSDQVSIGPVPLIKETQVATLQFDAPIHRLANRGEGNNNSLMTLSATLNSTVGPSVMFGGFLVIPSLQPVTTNNITITTNSVPDYYAGQTGKTGYYLTSRNTISATGLSAGGSVNTLTATQTFANSTVASASTTFYYDTPVTSAPTGSINGLNILLSTRVSGLSILHDTSANLTIDATAINMGKYFYRSPLITYNYTYPIDAVSGSTSVTKSETTLANVRPSDISGTMFTNGTLNFSSSVALTGINNSAYFKRSIAVDAYANNIFGAGGTMSGSLNIIMDPLSRALVYQTQPSSIPILTASTLALPTLIPGFRIWSAPITTNASAPATTVCPDLSYNGILYATMPYDNAGSLTSTDPSGCGTELLISNGLFVTPTTPSAYINYSTYAGNAGLDYSTITSTSSRYRFATFCWKLPTPTSYPNLTFTINSIHMLTRVTSTGVIRANGADMLVFYAFQNASDPSSFPSSNSNKYNSAWINANKAVTPSANGTTFANSYNNASTRFGSLGQASLNTTANVSTGTATFKVFIPVTSPVPANVYLYLRIASPMDKDTRFGSVYATLTTTT
jgi:hypothetical protein